MAKIGLKSTSLSKDLQNDTEPIKDLDSSKRFSASLIGNGFNILALKLSLGLKLTSAGPDVDVA